MRTTMEVLMTFLRCRFTSSNVHIPRFLKYRNRPTMTDIEAMANIVGRNHSYPSSPQYSVFESAAALLTLARPNRTSTTLGRQHIDAIIVDVETSLIKDLTFFSSFSIVSLPIETICKQARFTRICIGLYWQHINTVGPFA